jgi:methionine synthase II (cobalamin-independent)
VIVELPWPSASATGVGSLPYSDPLEAVRVVLGELPEFPHLPELPGRGPGADMVGRTAGLLVDIPVETQPSGWRLAARAGRDVRRARDMLAHDLDALEELAGRHTGALKIQLCGPWTLLASLERPNGHRAISDPGLRREVVESLVQGVTDHVHSVARRVASARLVLQLDEPSVPAVLAGRIPTASGLGTVGPMSSEDVRAGLAEVISAASLATTGDVPTAVHCCAEGAPVSLFRAAGAVAVSCDLERLTVADDEALGRAVDAGVSLWLGAVPATSSQPQDTELLPAQRQTAVRAPLSGPGAPLARTLAPVRSLWRRLDFSEEVARSRTVITPACGLAGADVAYAREAMTRVREAARAFSEDPYGSGAFGPEAGGERP